MENLLAEACNVSFHLRLVLGIYFTLPACLMLWLPLKGFIACFLSLKSLMLII